MSAVFVSNVVYKYKTENVLDALNANVNSSEIYALLGPSGCGKTTLMRLILGRIKLQSGYISVFGQKPGTVNHQISYMPQNSALCLHFTVEQTFKYFMHIYQISYQNFIKRYTKLKKILELPSNHFLIKDLSGGQQRRISLAAALINKCCLLILDEPTVGIDHLIIENIWKYLNNKCGKGLTILFVTHYMEEATNAHKIGFLRNGRLLIEREPIKLMNTFQEKSLENVFFKLCLKDNTNEKIENNFKDKCEYTWNSSKSEPKYKSVESKSLLQSLIFKFWIILVLMKRNLLKYMHMNTALICLLLPTTQILIYCLVYSKPVIEMRAAVVNQEIDPKYSQNILNELNIIERHQIKPILYPNLKSAINSVINGSSVGVIWIKENFSEAMDERLDNPFDVNPYVLDMSSLHLFIDNSGIMFGNVFVHSLSESLLKFISNLSHLRNQINFEIPIKVEKTAFSEGLLLKDFGLSANLLFFIYFSQIILSSLVLTQERKEGLFERSLIAGVSHHLVLISHFCTNLLLSIIQIVLMYWTAFHIFKEVNNGSSFVTLAFLLTQSLNAITSGLLISSIFKEEYHCMIILGFLCAPQLFTSGMFWPIESLNLYLRYASYCSPLAIPVETMRNILLRGWSFTNYHILLGFAINIIPSLLCFILSLFIFKYNEI